MPTPLDSVIAVDIGGTNLRAALISRDGSVLAKKAELTPQSGPNGSVVTESIIRLIRGILPLTQNLAAIGVSSAGPLDLKRGLIDHCPNIPFGQIGIVEPLQRIFGIPVYFFKDTHAGLLGEKFFGKGKKFSNLVYITISTGIGGGAMVNNRLLIGRNGNAAEIGFFGSLSHPTWNDSASGANLPKYFQAFCRSEKIEADFEAESPQSIFEAVRRGHVVAVRFMDRLGRVHARGLSNVIVAYDPECVIFGGSIIEHQHDLLIPAMLRYTERYLPLPRLERTALGDNVSLLGAAAGVFFEGQY